MDGRFFFFFVCGGFWSPQWRLMLVVAVTIAIGFYGGCFYIILKNCIYYFKRSGKKIELLMHNVL